MRGDRFDARRVRDIDNLHVILPHLMDKRTDSEAFVDMEFDVTEVLQYIAGKNEGEPEYHTTLFHCILMAVAKTLYMRPALNRYISGRHYYERREITLGFVAKKRFVDHSEEELVLETMPEDCVLSDVTRRVVGNVHEIREGKIEGANNALDILRKLPRPLLSLTVRVLKILDFYGKVPSGVREGDPNFASVFLTNLGSIKCPCVYHHLNNYGTNSIMIAIGTIHKTEKLMPDGSRAVRDVVNLGVTLDERIADGFYFARSLKIIQHMFSHPDLFELPLKEKFDYE